MSEAIDAYLDAVNKRDAAAAAVRKLLDVVRACDRTVTGMGFHTAIIPGVVAPNIAATKQVPIEFDPAEWPTWDSIAKAIQEYRLATTAALNKWQQVPVEHRKHLSPPPTH